MITLIAVSHLIAMEANNQTKQTKTDEPAKRGLENNNQTKEKEKMNPVTQFTKIRILPYLIASALIALTAVPARATPACNFSGTQLAMGTFPEGLLDLMCKDLPGWDLKFKVKGDTDVYVFQNTWQPLGHTGWHTHPGPSLLFVISGQITAYDASDSPARPLPTQQGRS